MSEIDTIDRAIIQLLLKDGRLPSAEIARRIQTSGRSVRYRINRLIAGGVIQVSAILNPKAVGFPVTADVWLEIEPGHVLEAGRRLAQFEQVSYVACATGDRDLSIQVHARNNDELYRFVTEVVATVPSVRKTTTILVPLVLKDVYDWNIPPALDDGSTGKEQKK